MFLSGPGRAPRLSGHTFPLVGASSPAIIFLLCAQPDEGFFHRVFRSFGVNQDRQFCRVNLPAYGISGFDHCFRAVPRLRKLQIVFRVRCKNQRITIVNKTPRRIVLQIVFSSSFIFLRTGAEPLRNLVNRTPRLATGSAGRVQSGSESNSRYAG